MRNENEKKKNRKISREQNRRKTKRDEEKNKRAVRKTLHSIAVNPVADGRPATHGHANVRTDGDKD